MTARRLVVDLASTAGIWALPADGADRLRRATPNDWEVVIARTPVRSDGDGGHGASPEVLRAIADAEVYFGFGFTRDLFAAAPRLRWVHSAAAGVTSLLFDELVASALVVTNSAGIMGDPIAELVLGGVLYFLRRLDVAVEQQRRGEWNKAPFTGEGTAVRELAECRALILGTGGIGSAVARRLGAMGCHCTGLRRRPDLGTPEGFARVTGFEHLDAELTQADILVLATPLTRLTRGMLSAARLDCLPAGAIVVNVARGALLDEEALIDRLERGSVRAAVLDVFRHEPLSASSRLWQLPNVLITPHVSAVSPRLFWERELSLFLENWERFRAGQQLRNRIDPEAGY